MMHAQRSVTVREAASYVGLSCSTLNKLRCLGGGPVYFKLGRAVRYDLTDLDKWLIDRRLEHTSHATAEMRGS